MKCLITVFFIFIFLISCDSGNAPKGIIQEDEMISLLTDIHIIDGYAIMLGQDTAKQTVDRLYNSVYKKYQTDSTQFRRSMDYYTNNAEQFASMYEIINQNLERLQEEPLKRSAEQELRNDLSR